MHDRCLHWFNTGGIAANWRALDPTGVKTSLLALPPSQLDPQVANWKSQAGRNFNWKIRETRGLIRETGLARNLRRTLCFLKGAVKAKVHPEMSVKGDPSEIPWEQFHILL